MHYLSVWGGDAVDFLLLNRFYTLLFAIFSVKLKFIAQYFGTEVFGKNETGGRICSSNPMATREIWD